MKLSSMPSLVAVPFADQGTKNAIPVESQIGITDGAASFTDGFPPLTMTPVVAGGIPPAGGDFNGILNALTQSVRWACAGGQYKYDGAFSTTVGGYPKGAMIQNPAGDVIWLNTVDDNNTNPDNGTGWIPAIRYGLTNIALAGSNVTLTPSQAAKETITLTGTLTANVQVIMPAWVETWLIINNTTGGFVVSVKTASGSGVNLAAATSSQIYGDGTNIYYGALMVKNNFAEIKAAGTNSQTAARGNIGCGTASTHDVTTSPLDVTVGRVLKVGDLGMSQLYLPAGIGIDFSTYVWVSKSTQIIDYTKSTNVPANWPKQAATISVYCRHTSTSSEPQSQSVLLDLYPYGAYSSSPSFLAIKSANVWTFAKNYTSLNKPTAAEVGAVPLNADGSVDKIKTIKNITGIYTTTTSAPLELGHLAGTPGDFYIDIHTDGTLNGQDYKYRLTFNSESLSTTVTGQWIPGDYGNFDARYYTQSAANAKFVQNIQLGAQTNYTPPGGNESSWTYDAPAGCVLTGIVVQDTGESSADNIGGVHVQPIQKNINGTWTTIAG